MAVIIGLFRVKAALVKVFGLIYRAVNTSCAATDATITAKALIL